MKTIYLLRHAKSDWGAGADDDHERPLARRGVKAARAMGRFLADADQVPDQVYTSSARRAATTVELAAEEGAWRCPVEVVPGLYGTHAEAVVDFVRGFDESLESVLLVGHEPTWSSLVTRLTGGVRVRFPTAAIARIDCDVAGWREVREGAGELVWLIPPRVLKNAR